MEEGGVSQCLLGKTEKNVLLFFIPSSNSNIFFFFSPRLYLEALLHYLMGFFTQVSHPFYTNGSLDILHLPHCMLLTMRQYQDSSESSFSANIFDFQQKSLFSSGKQVFFYIIFLLVKCSAFFVKIYFVAGIFQTVPHRKLKQSPVGEGRRTALALTKFCNLHFYSRQEGLELVGVCQANGKKKKNESSSVLLRTLTIMPKKVTSVMRAVCSSKQTAVFPTISQQRTLKTW